MSALCQLSDEHKRSARNSIILLVGYCISCMGMGAYPIHCTTTFATRSLDHVWHSPQMNTKRLPYITEYLISSYTMNRREEERMHIDEG